LNKDKLDCIIKTHTNNVMHAVSLGESHTAFQGRMCHGQVPYGINAWPRELRSRNLVIIWWAASYTKPLL